MPAPGPGGRATHVWTPARSAAGRHSPWLIATIISISAFMEVLDTAIANVSLRHIAGSMAASYDQATWVLTSYLIANAVVIPMSSWLSNVFGRKRYYMASVALFTISSLCCGLAPSLTFLIAARVAQGIGGGGLAPVTQAMLIDTFPPASRGKAMSVYGFTVILAPMLGPLLGGLITDRYSWHWIFLINVPVGLLSLSLVEAFVDEPKLLVEERLARWARGIRFDLLGALLIALGLGFLEVMTDRGVQDGWFSSPTIRISALISGVCIVSFVLWELFAREPLLEMRLFKHRNFAVGTLIIMVIGVILFGTTQFVPQFTQQVLGYTATQAGLALTLGGMITLVTMPLAGMLTGRFRPRTLMAAAFGVIAISLYMMSHFTLSVTFAQIAYARAWQSGGIPFLFVPLISAAYVGVPPDRTGNAAAMIGVGRNLGGSIGIAMVQALLARREQFHQVRMVSGLQPLNPIYEHAVRTLSHAFATRGAAPAAAVHMAIGEIYAMMQRQALMMSFEDVFRALMLFVLVISPILLLLKRGPTEHRSGAEAAGEAIG
ncbi:MAG: DHA2 family efflux MFS transporter permease subunit [Pseudomonadota bacterium]|nr:DHA2 family efflux MFS transporter permease subunit [Pseudomonadota bacterium]